MHGGLEQGQAPQSGWGKPGTLRDVHFGNGHTPVSPSPSLPLTLACTLPEDVTTAAGK